MLVLGVPPDGLVSLEDEKTGTKIWVKLIVQKGGRTRLGFIAPPHVKILRDNIKKRTERNGD